MFGLAVAMAVRAAQRVAAATNLERMLLAMSSQQADGTLLLDADTPAAFTAGLGNPRFFLTRPLLEALSPEEYEVIRLHELAHVRRRDPLRKTVFQLLSGFFPGSVARALNSHMNTAIEQSADMSVANAIPDHALIARVLWKVRRLTLSAEHRRGTTFSLCHFGLDNVDQRIGYLLSDSRGRGLPLAVAALTLFMLSIGCAVAADSVHHFIEHALQHL